jgi:hypothetical protein
MIENIRDKMLLTHSFYILKYLKQQQDYDRMVEDLMYEDECYYSPEYNYLIFS